MQSSVRSVLQVLDRTHDPERVPQAVDWARAAGFDQVSLDLIYGTPGETLDDWRTSLSDALACAPDHLSAYALIVEDGTALARRVRRGELPAPDDDDLADKYLLAEELLAAAGLHWYEVSNWARDERRPLPAQPALLARRRLVGGRPRRALPRRRGALVERQAPGGVRRPPRRGGEPGRGPRDPRRRDQAARARPAGDAAGRGAAARRSSTTRAGPGSRTWPGAASARSWRTGSCSRCAVACWPTAWSASSCPERPALEGQ